ncbi:hypothetical protein L6164_015592 [Bauhinia variegata]|uniref:Uncharacterized protein n=1 Tax=Bauhinia variegata TaxID=167791 RepID=A0ACB9NM48_BAUVA|nr:hypothetical protein L6164_015592 [Bauhinia variegata]
MDDGVNVNGHEQSQSQSRKKNKACAPCRHQRRRCPSNCPLAPYFPADQEQDFLNAHKLFGVGNILKIIQACQNSEQKRMAAQTMKWEANRRADVDPVYGSAGIVWDFCQKIQSCQLELHSLLHQLALYRPQSQLQLQHQRQNVNYPISGPLKLDGEGSPFPDQNHQNDGS